MAREMLESLKVAYPLDTADVPKGPLRAALYNLSSAGVARLNEELAKRGVSVNWVSGEVLLADGSRVGQVDK